MGNWTLKLTLITLSVVALLSCSKLGFEGNKSGKAIRTTHMLFGCLKDTDGGGPLGDVVYNKNTATISMNWKLARGANGDVRYTVSELGTGEVLKITSDNSFEMKVNPLVPQTYTLLVEAEDKDGITTCGSQEKYVQVGIGNAPAPTMGKSWAFATSQNMIL